ncbi:hypothetical protein FH039_05300 [Thermococcus indicus]|uniref:Uncharacterized protein n=1 Tax=Thermococcus indicus TaxID=2586643 RepID=A0A4Y5SMD4_9EURY|nr:hypothetical protein [Thermococcus indicus]QDA31130.1 hypothetical protein FH039_05300 [Thermococcus indicus]
MTDVREMIRDKVKEAVEKKLEGLFIDFLTKEFVERRKYRELLAVWLIAHPELYSYPKILEVECYHREYCRVGDTRILEYKAIMAITRQIVKSYESELVLNAQNALDGIIRNPSSVDEKITTRQIYTSTLNSLKEGIQKYVENQESTLKFNVGYESIYLEPPKILSKAAEFILERDRNVTGYFEKELIENIRVLSKEAKMAFVVLSAYPRTHNGAPFSLSTFDVVWEVVSQESLKASKLNTGWVREELYKAGLIASADKNIVPPFALDIWKNAANIREIIPDVPPEVVARVRTILSWREVND